MCYVTIEPRIVFHWGLENGVHTLDFIVIGFDCCGIEGSCFRNSKGVVYDFTK